MDSHCAPVADRMKSEHQQHRGVQLGRTCGLFFLCCLFVTNISSTLVFALAPTWNLRARESASYARRTSSLVALEAAGRSDREADIRRKLMKLRKQGKLPSSTSGATSSSKNQETDYSSKIRQKLGKAKGKMLGFDFEDDQDDEDLALYQELEEDDEDYFESQSPRLGHLENIAKEEEELASATTSVGAAQQYLDQLETQSQVTSTSEGKRDPVQNYLKIDASLFEDEEEDMDEEELLERVERKMMEKRMLKKQEQEEELLAKARERQKKQLTSGVGGSWNENRTAAEDIYKPKTGSWGAFPRPRDISKAYGGGRRIGPGFSNEAEKIKSEEETRERLKRYREKVGIEVQSEKDNAATIEEASKIASLAMERGVYSTAVSALEKVTKFCSTNSKVGGQVYLDLAMAYEAAGRADEAIVVYTALTKSRNERVKDNAKRLLYGIEAMQFMQNEMKDTNFSRKRAKQTFIDTTGFIDIASNFDDRYNTAYVDLDNGFYKQLTKSVVRSCREARQIILKATGAGDVGRMRIVQALRALSRGFDDSLQAEIENTALREPVAMIDGKPLVIKRTPKEENPLVQDPDEFMLLPACQMVENLDGEWRLQLLADKKGDGVKFFNSTNTWQRIDTANMKFDSKTPSGFVSIEQNGSIEFNEKRRILRRSSVEIVQGSVFANLFGTTTGAQGAVNLPQQIISVDSVLMITRGVPSRRGNARNNEEKDYFAVWRKL